MYLHLTDNHNVRQINPFQSIVLTLTQDRFASYKKFLKALKPAYIIFSLATTTTCEFADDK